MNTTDCGAKVKAQEPKEFADIQNSIHSSLENLEKKISALESALAGTVLSPAPAAPAPQKDEPPVRQYDTPLCQELSFIRDHINKLEYFVQELSSRIHI